MESTTRLHRTITSALYMPKRTKESRGRPKKPDEKTDIIEAKVLRWGNSYGLRIGKKELEAAGLKPGEEIRVEILGPTDVDISHVRFIEGGEPDLSERHDKILADARARRLHGGKERGSRR